MYASKGQRFRNKSSIDTIIGRIFSRIISFDTFSFLGDSVRECYESIPENYVVEIDRLEK
jgi:hypothetical protein